MLIKTQAFFLRKVKYGENSAICTFYTRESGLESFMINGVRNQKGLIKPAYLFPMSVSEISYQKRNNSQLQRISDFRLEDLSQFHNQSLQKNAISGFIAEVINSSIKEHQTDKTLFDFILNFVDLIQLQSASSHLLPCLFLLKLSRYLGFYPQRNYSEESLFDCIEGKFVSNEHSFTSDKTCAKNIHAMMETSITEMTELNINLAQSRNILDNLLTYYKFQMVDFSVPDGLNILREIFS
jgi:DNA repair protein RecO (recombination protein O)